MSDRLIDPGFIRSNTHFLTFLNLSGYEGGRTNWFDTTMPLAQCRSEAGIRAWAAATT
jgi:hypothetical protein